MIQSKMAFTSYLLLAFFAQSFAPASRAVWDPVPIRTAPQKIAGCPGGEGFQQVYAVAYAPSDPKVVYLSSDTSQVWKSVDEGSSWMPKSSGFLANGARSLGVDPVNPQTVFAAGFFGQSYEVASQYPHRLQGIYRTLDGGESWRLVRKAEFYAQASKGSLFAFDSSSSADGRTKTVFAATFDAGLLCSEDGGETWKSLGTPSAHILDIKEDPASPGELFVAAENGLYKYGQSRFQRIGGGLPGFPRSIGVSGAAPRVLYAAVGEQGVFRSDDAGSSFYPLGVLTAPLKANFTEIAVSPADANMVYVKADQSSLFREPFFSHDGGKTWRSPTSTDFGDLLLDGHEGFWFSAPFAPHPRDPLAAITISNGRGRILKTLDGGARWAYCGNGYTGARLNDILFGADGRMIFCLTDFGLLLTEDQGATFSELAIPRILKQKSCGASAMRGTTIVASLGTWHDKGLAVSHDGGSSWQSFEQMIDTYDFVSFHTSQDSIVYAGPYRSRDTGRTWSKVAHPIRAMYAGNGDIVYATSPTGPSNCTLLVSRDQGTTWSSPYPPCPFGEAAIQKILPAPDTPDRVFVATSWGLWILDGGRWVLRDQRQGLEKDSFGLCFISCIAIDPNRPSVIYAGRRAPGYGHSNGVFRSTDGGLSWQNVTGNLGSECTVWSLALNPTDGTVYLGTSHGVFRLRAELATAAK